MSTRTFHQEARTRWISAIKAAAGPAIPNSSIWTGAKSIAEILAHIMGHNNNHTHLPGGGGLDMERVRPAMNEPGCLEFFPHNTNGVLYLVKPKRLTLEFLENAPAESFFHLEIEELQPSGAYPERDSEPENDEDDRYATYSEEVVEVAPGKYISRSGWDEDAYPDGRDLPGDARLVVRQFRGALMAVTKGSLWNGASATYDGRHSRMTPRQIRSVIERSIN